MNTNYVVRLSSPRRLVLILVLALLLLLVVTQFSAAAGSGGGSAQWQRAGSGEGITRWQRLGLMPTGSMPKFADSTDWYVVSFNGSGTVGPSEVFHFYAPNREYRGPTFSFPNQAGTTDLVDSFHVYYDPQSQ
jgi:hypothetical protein